MPLITRCVPFYNQLLCEQKQKLHNWVTVIILIAWLVAVEWIGIYAFFSLAKCCHFYDLPVVALRTVSSDRQLDQRGIPKSDFRRVSKRRMQLSEAQKRAF